jgi:hypothetical protein
VCWPATISSGFWPAGPDVPATRIRNDGTAGVHVDGVRRRRFGRLQPTHALLQCPSCGSTRVARVPKCVSMSLEA